MAIQNKADLFSAGRTIHAGIILFGGETELLDIAPIDFFNAITTKFTKFVPEQVMPDEMRKQSLDVQFHWVNETGNPAALTADMKVLPSDTFKTCPPLDIVLVGAYNFGYQPSEAELDYLRKSYAECSHFLTVCGGCMAPLQAGLLSGQTATAPRMLLDMLKQQAPDVKWTEKRWQKSEDGKLWTTGALLSGTDMIRAWAAENLGHGDQNLASFMLDGGCYPVRDVDYKDELPTSMVTPQIVQKA